MWLLMVRCVFWGNNSSGLSSKLAVEHHVPQGLCSDRKKLSRDSHLPLSETEPEPRVLSVSLVLTPFVCLESWANFRCVYR